MVPALARFHSPRLLHILASLLASYVRPPPRPGLARRELHDPEHRGQLIAFGILIPILVLLSGLFAGLTLGYMSLDETQLNVLSVSGTPKQKMYASKIKPIRKNGHLLLVTLLLANMIVNETLPVIADPVLGGGVQSVVVSTVLIVIFSEIIPQSLCTRYGLYFGAKMAGFVRILIWTLGIVAWPVAKLLELALGPHHGIIYRRAELKELIAMHSNNGKLGGDLKHDTVTIIGGALDLQEKVVKQAMTPIENVFMLSIDAQLDYETLRKICMTGHSRIPVYEEVEIPVPRLLAQSMDGYTSRLSLDGKQQVMQKVKKIIGILLVKQCVLLDPKDATPLRKIPLNKVPFVPNNEPLLGILDKFQEGRSHIAIVSRFSVETAASVKKAVKRGLTQRLRSRVGMGDSDSSTSSSEDDSASDRPRRRVRIGRRTKSRETDETQKDEYHADEETEAGHSNSAGRRAGRKQRRKSKQGDVEMGMKPEENAAGPKKHGIGLPRISGFGRWEQSMPADAVLTKEGVAEFLQSVDPTVMPLGIITLEDVLEELIGEEIYDEFDPQGHPDLSSYAQREGKLAASMKRNGSAPQLAAASGAPAAPSPAVPLVKPIAIPALKSLNLKGLGFPRPRSAPPDKARPDPEKHALPPPAPERSVSSGEATIVESPQPLATETLAAASPSPSVVIPPLSTLAAANLGRARSVHGGIPVVPVVPTPPASPPPFEQAILVERKRRAASSSGGPGAQKGGWFKSSPLSGDRQGFVVAEHVRRSVSGAGTGRGDLAVQDGGEGESAVLDRVGGEGGVS